jgi:anti-sigma-K factor RskA
MLVTGDRLKMNNSLQADAAFLRRVFMALVALTVVAGAMVGLTTAQAMTEKPAVAVASKPAS